MKTKAIKRTGLLQFRVSEEELSTIVASAKTCGINCAEYLRRVAMGFSPAIRVDQIAKVELCKVAGDLGRLGGLLKLWMAQKRGATSDYKDGIDINSIDSLWNDIRKCVGLLKQRIASL